MIEDNQVINSRPESPVTKALTQITSFYEEIRELFGTSVCWVVEMQLTDSGELYFLQRTIGPKVVKKPTWEFSEADEYYLKIGVESDYGDVIGATDEKGVEIMFYTYTNSIFPQPFVGRVVKQSEYKRGGTCFVPKPLTAGFSMSDGHSAVIPIARSGLFVSAPKFSEYIQKDFGEQIVNIHLEAERKLGNKVEKHENGGYTISGRGRRSNRGEEAHNYARVRLNIRSNGREARIRILEIF